MQYLHYTYVDAETGVPVTDAPARNGPAPPAVDGLTFAFALESRYPTDVPALYGTAPDDADTEHPGVLAHLDAEAFAAARAAELDARKRQAQRRRRAVRQRAIDGGFVVGGARVQSDLESRLLLQGAVALAQAAIAAGTEADYAASLGEGWRDADDGIVATDAAGMLALGQALAAHIAACDAASQATKAAIVAAEDFAALAAVDLAAGYPDTTP